MADLEKLYSEGKGVSHAAGLAAVHSDGYEAGRLSMVVEMAFIPPATTPLPVEVAKPVVVAKKKPKKGKR